MRQLLTILCLLIVWLNGYSNNWYFSNAGNDGNSGSLASPWQSIAKFNSVFASKAPGDSFLFRKGDTFYGSLTISRSGSSGLPIVISGYGTGAMPIITGFTDVVAWTNLGSNIWESTFAVSTLTTCNMVVINGVNTGMGRQPNSGYYTISAATSNTSITSSSLTGTPNWTGAEVVIRKIAWITDRSPITSQTGGTINYTSPDSYTGTVGWGFFIQNDARTLDVQNEWYYSPTTKKIRVYSTTMPGTVQVSTVDTLVKISARNFITFDHISFTGANKFAFQATAANITVQYCQILYPGIYAFWGAQNISPSQNLIFQYNTIINSNNNGIDIRDNFTNALIQRNVFKNIGIIEGMTDRLSNSNGFGNAIQVRADNALIQYNTVDSCGYAGIEFFNNNDIIQFNFINHPMNKLGDGGGAYAWVGWDAGGNYNPTKSGQRLHKNIILNSWSPTAGTTFVSGILNQGQGIYLDDRSKGVIVDSNTVAGCGYSGLFLHNTDSVNVYGNTFFDNGIGVTMNSATSSPNIASPVRRTTYKNNISFSKVAAQPVSYMNSKANDITSFGTSSSIDSNYWVRPIQDDIVFKLQFGSPVVNASQNLAQWKTYSGFDINSNKSPVTITSIAQIFFAYNPTDHDSTVTLPAGSWKDVRNSSYVTSTVIHSFESVILMGIGLLITPTITWANPTAITYPTAISSTQLNATTLVAGTFSYFIGATPLTIGTVLPAGTYTLTVRFDPADPATYTSNTKSVTLVVNPQAATITVFNTSKVYSGLPQLPDVTTSPSGLPYSITLNGTTGGKINAGTYTYVVGINDPNSTATTRTGFFTITKELDTIIASSKTVNFDGNVQTITATTTKGLGAFLTYTYNGGAASSAAGVYQVIIQENETNHQAVPDTVTLTIVNNAALIFISDSLATFDSTTKNVTVTSAYTYSVVYSPSTHINAGTYQVIATINDGVHVGADTATLTIQKRQSVLSWSPIAPIPYGAQLTSLILNATADVAGHFNYSLPIGTIPGVGVTGLIATFVPDDSANILGGTISNTVNVYGVNPFKNFYIIGPGGVIYIKQ